MILRRFNFNTEPLRARTKNVMLRVPHCKYGIQKSPSKEHKNGTKCLKKQFFFWLQNSQKLRNGNFERVFPI